MRRLSPGPRVAERRQRRAGAAARAATSNAWASAISRGSLHAGPMKDSPTGRPLHLAGRHA